VSIGRLVSLIKAGSGLLEDLTWSTIPYVMWVQCEGPVSVMSVSLPNIVYLFRRWSGRGTKAENSGSTPPQGSHNSSSTGSRKFIRLEPYRGEGIGHQTHVSSRPRGLDPDYDGSNVNITHEVDVTEHRRLEVV
jgi:hypothetical protein